MKFKRREIAIGVMVVISLLLTIPSHIPPPHLIQHWQQELIPQPYPNILVKLTTPKYSYAFDELIHIQLEAINLTNDTTDIGFRSTYEAGYEILQIGELPRMDAYVGSGNAIAYGYQIPAQRSKKWVWRYRPDPSDLASGIYVIHAWVVRYGHAFTTITIGPPTQITWSSINGLISRWLQTSIITLLSITGAQFIIHRPSNSKKK